MKKIHTVESPQVTIERSQKEINRDLKTVYKIIESEFIERLNNVPDDMTWEELERMLLEGLE